MVLMLPQRGKDAPPDKYNEVWKEVNGPDSSPPPPMLGGNYYVDESADYAEQQGRRSTSPTRCARRSGTTISIRRASSRTSRATSTTRTWSSPPRQIDDYVEKFGKGAVTGTPQMILDRMWELKEIRPAGLLPARLLRRHAAGRGAQEHAPVRREGAARAQELGSRNLASTTASSKRRSRGGWSNVIANPEGVKQSRPSWIAARRRRSR